MLKHWPKVFISWRQGRQSWQLLIHGHSPCDRTISMSKSVFPEIYITTEHHCYTGSQYYYLFSSFFPSKSAATGTTVFKYSTDHRLLRQFPDLVCKCKNMFQKQRTGHEMFLLSDNFPVAELHIFKKTTKNKTLIRVLRHSLNKFQYFQRKCQMSYFTLNFMMWDSSLNISEHPNV